MTKFQTADKFVYNSDPTHLSCVCMGLCSTRGGVLGGGGAGAIERPFLLIDPNSLARTCFKLDGIVFATATTLNKVCKL